MDAISVCSVSQSFHPYLGGLTKYLNALGREFVRNGHEFRVIHLKTPYISSIDFHDGIELIRTDIGRLGDKQMERYGEFKETILGVTHGEKSEVAPLPREDSAFYKSYIRLNEKLQERICEVYDHKPFDILHIHDFQLLPIASMLRGKLPGIPILFTWHIPFKMSIAEGWREFFVRYMRFYDAVIFSTDEYAKAAVKSGLEKGKVRRIYPFIDASEYCYEGENDAREKLGIPEGDLLVLCVSRMDPRKGQDVLIKAMKRVHCANKMVHCVFVGNGSFSKQLVKKRRSKWQDRLTALVERLGLGSAVRFMGHLENNELYKLYDASDIVVQPSKDEGFGLTVSEAMVFRKPVIGSSTGGIPVQITHGYNGYLFEPEDHDELASLILELSYDGKLRRDMGINGGRVVRSEFSSGRGYKEHIELYRKLLSGFSGRNSRSSL